MIERYTLYDYFLENLFLSIFIRTLHSFFDQKGWSFLHYEERNPFDRYAIKVYEIGNETPVGHLPREISRVTKFFMDRGATIEADLTTRKQKTSEVFLRDRDKATTDKNTDKKHKKYYTNRLD